MTSALTREERLALLAAASGDELIDAADACLAAASSFAVVTGKVLGAGGERAVAGTGPSFGTAVSPLTGAIVAAWDVSFDVAPGEALGLGPLELTSLPD